jgi:DNA-binding winged helix-turn-helix (wHTH) protein
MRLRFEDFVLDTEIRELRRGDGVVKLQPKVFDLLLHLVENRSRLVTREELLAAVWDGTWWGTRRSRAPCARCGRRSAMTARRSGS